jgi:hypothetical protein
MLLAAAAAAGFDVQAFVHGWHACGQMPVAAAADTEEVDGARWECDQPAHCCSERMLAAGKMQLAGGYVAAKQVAAVTDQHIRWCSQVGVLLAHCLSRKHIAGCACSKILLLFPLDWALLAVAADADAEHLGRNLYLRRRSCQMHSVQFEPQRAQNWAEHETCPR